MHVSKSIRKTLKVWEAEFLKQCKGHTPTYTQWVAKYGGRVIGVANIHRRLKRAYQRGGWVEAHATYIRMAQQAFIGDPIIDNRKGLYKRK